MDDDAGVVAGVDERRTVVAIGDVVVEVGGCAVVVLGGTVAEVDGLAAALLSSSNNVTIPLSMMSVLGLIIAHWFFTLR